eukprot:646283-Amorphochlora_amoeboformis.AAC.1
MKTAKISKLVKSICPGVCGRRAREREKREERERKKKNERNMSSRQEAEMRGKKRGGREEGSRRERGWKRQEKDIDDGKGNGEGGEGDS